MSSTSISLTVFPSGGDDQPVLAADFFKQAEAIKQIASLSISDPDTKAKMQVVGLSMNSPATIVIDAFEPDVPSLFSAMFGVFRGKGAPNFVARQVFDRFKELTSSIGHGVRKIRLAIDGDSLDIDVNNASYLDSVIENDYVMDGEIDGRIEGINIHGKQNRFILYPVVGPARLSCLFSEKMTTEVQNYLGGYVQVSGQLKYRWRDEFPYEARVERLDVFSDDQPSIMDLLGLAPDATGGVPAEDFVRRSRLEWR